MADAASADRLGLPEFSPGRPVINDNVRWELDTGVVRFGKVTAYQTNMRAEVVGLVVEMRNGETMSWPTHGVTVVDKTDPDQLMEWLDG